MTSNLVIVLTGIVGLLSTILKIYLDNKNKSQTPEAKYEQDIQKFDQAIANNNADDITTAFEQLHAEALKRGGDSGGQSSEEITKR